MPDLLLISSSSHHGFDLLAHCQEAICRHFSGMSKVLFVPYALADRDNYRDVIAAALKPMGIALESIHDAPNPTRAIEHATGIFVGGGNSFRLLKTLYDLNLLDPIRKAVRDRQVPYMGSSAGTNLACPTIRTTNDMPIVEPLSLQALGLVPFQINPHFIDADPSSTHKGETREQRLQEYLEENSIPVAGIREGSWLEIHGDRCVLGGTTGMKLFRRDHPAEEIAASDVTDRLIRSA